ncbi:DUF1772 domain-containing protein [Actinocrispum wychmicini]|uniref:Putative membrane protein n=1 Tax=Actinocrispum wychmicini TaxID=1213861 RepID=A0A4R2J708_9PSEU|nr:DUF1772 domain-containing protein [Actinocrispum wychmicini]TCO52346.1 putative membrane protein [Actinocrispum wychmicini]
MPNATARPRSKAATPLLWLSTLTMGLMAGFFWAFSVLVMPSLKNADDRTFVAGFQEINRGVKSGGFAFGFFGAFIFTGAAAIVHQRMGRRAAARWIFAALLLYIVALAVTIGGNIPLNNKLDQFGDPAKIADLAGARAAFNEPAWNSMNAVRTVATTLGLLALGAALVDHGRAQIPAAE